MNKQEIELLIKEPKAQSIISSTEFYFQKGREALQRWLSMQLSTGIETLIKEQQDDYAWLLNEAKSNPELNEVLDLLFEVISYCDLMAREKRRYNKYEDKRTLAKASVRMGNWVEHLIEFRFNRAHMAFGSTLNAFNFLLDPQNGTTALSENHRALISVNLLGKEYAPTSFIQDLRSYFSQFQLKTVNPENYTLLLAFILYHQKEEWLEEVVALMAADSTGWQDGYAEPLKKHRAAIVWNSKRPSGSPATLNFLRNIIKDGESFPLFYSSGGYVRFRAEVIDFADRADVYNQKNWNKNGDVYGYEEDFDDYHDDNKGAKIVFMIKSLEKIDPVKVESFSFYKGYDVPRHDNISPVKALPQLLSASGQLRYSPEEFEQLYTNYLNREIPGSTTVYKSSMSTITRILKRLNAIDDSAYEIQDLPAVESAESVFTADQEYQDLNNKGNNRLSSAWSHYRNFVREINSPPSVSEQKHSAMSTENHSLNLILFGPPGTGKTYKSIEKAVQLLDIQTEGLKREEIKALYDEKVKEGQIAFVTFHQSMSYEDFVEGIKPLEPKSEGQPVTYKVVNGILKEFCAQIRSNELLTNQQSKVRTVNNFDELYLAFQIQLNLMMNSEDEGQFPSLPSRRSNVKVLKVEGDTIITIGQTASSPETIQKDKLRRIYDKYSQPEDIKKLVDLRTEIGTDIGWITNYYALFKALKDFEQSQSKIGPAKLVAGQEKKYVLIIDEINRGNVSQIFGELITLLEDDKRIGRAESLEVTLPYSKSKFSVPSNLYIIGTMNTADRSVEALDTALRRRFAFEEIPPDYSIKELNYEYAGFNASDILKTINRRIEKLIDKDHQIGHSFLLKKDDVPAEKKMKEAFYKNIIPLLQEYFFGDYGKIGLVLGAGFVSLKSWGKSKDDFADFEHEAKEDFADKPVYEIIDYNKKPSFQNVKGEEVNFEKAIQVLMK